MSDFICKIVLPKNDRNEYITAIVVRDTTREDAAKLALDDCKRRPWVKLSDIEKEKIAVSEVRTY